CKPLLRVKRLLARRKDERLATILAGDGAVLVTQRKASSILGTWATAEPRLLRRLLPAPTPLSLVGIRIAASISPFAIGTRLATVGTTPSSKFEVQSSEEGGLRGPS